MDANFWHARWERNEIGFHGRETNPLLVEHFDALALAPASCIFLPLCGKTLDIHWLLAQGYHVVGAELSPLAIRQLFAELGVEPAVSHIGPFEHYAAENLDIYVGDFFNLTPEILGAVDAVYDRAALVALPQTVRPRYTAHLAAITHAAPQFLICFEYEQSLHAGPPFSVDGDELRQHYEGSYHLTRLARVDVRGGLKGKYPATESAWLLQRR